MCSRNSKFIPNASVLSKNSKLGSESGNECRISNTNRSVDSLNLDLDKDREGGVNQSNKSDQLKTMLERNEATGTPYKLYESEATTERADEKRPAVEQGAEVNDVFSSSSSSQLEPEDTLYRTFKEVLDGANMQNQNEEDGNLEENTDDELDGINELFSARMSHTPI